MPDSYLWIQETLGERHNVWCRWLLWGPYIRNVTICDNHLLANGLPSARVVLCWAGWFDNKENVRWWTRGCCSSSRASWKTDGVILMPANCFFAEAGVVWMTNGVVGMGAAPAQQTWLLICKSDSRCRGLCFCFKLPLEKRRELVWLPTFWPAWWSNLSGWSLFYDMAFLPFLGCR